MEYQICCKRGGQPEGCSGAPQHIAIALQRIFRSSSWHARGVVLIKEDTSGIILPHYIERAPTFRNCGLLPLSIGALILWGVLVGQGIGMRMAPTP